MRVFVALDLTPEARKEIEKLLKNLAKKYWKVKWEKSEKVHITLAFFAHLDEEKLALLKEVCQKIAENLTAFALSFKGLGCFPDFDWPRIIWLGLKGDLKSLAGLEQKLRERLKESGFETEKRPFHPHITLGRIKRARGRERREIGRQIKGLRKLDFKSQWLVDKLVIYESKCLAEGSVYRKIKEFSFERINDKINQDEKS